MMRSSNDQKKGSEEASSSSTLKSTVATSFNFLSKKAKSISELTFYERDKVEKKDPASHAPSKAYKNGYLHFSKSPYDPNKKYTLEELMHIAGSVYIEVVSAALCQLYNPELVPPSTRARYDKEFRLSVDSKNFAGFVPMKSQPLQESDLSIELIDNSAESHNKILTEFTSTAELLVKHLNNLPKEETPTTYLGWGLNLLTSAKNSVKTSFNRHRFTTTGIQVQDALKAFLDKKECTRDKLLDLLNLLTARQNHIAEWAVGQEKYKQEFAYLESCIFYVSKLYMQSQQNDINHVDIKQFEKLDRILEKKGTQLDDCDFFVIPKEQQLDVNELSTIPHSRCAFILRGNGFLYVDRGITQDETFNKKMPKGVSLPNEMIDKLIKELELDHPGLKCCEGKTRPMIEKLTPTQLDKIKQITGYDHQAKQKAFENEKLTEMIDGKLFSISVKEFLKYRRQRGIICGLDLTIGEYNVDGHGENFGIDGKLVDFGQYNWPESSRYVVLSKLEEMYLGKAPTKLKRTVADKRQFPNISDANPFRYLPIKATVGAISSTILSGAQQVFTSIGEKTKNFSSQQESNVFKKLVISPITEYHKFKQDLKKMLVSNDTLKALIYLEVPKDIILKQDPKITDEEIKKIADVLFARKISEKADIKAVVYEMQEFKEFLQKNGSYVYECIVEEYKKYQDKLIKKMSCDFITLNEMPNSDNFKKLPGESRFAYAMYDNRLFYIDKKKKSVEELQIQVKENELTHNTAEQVKKEKIQKLKSFFNVKETNQPVCLEKTLSLDHYQLLFDYTTHRHKKIHYYNLINSFDFDKMKEEYQKICKAVNLSVIENSGDVSLDNNSTLETICSTTPVPQSFMTQMKRR